MRGATALLMTLSLLAGCAGSGQTKSTDTVVGITTLEQELSLAQSRLKKTVESLGSVVNSSGGDLSGSYERYLNDLASLDASVQTLRDRSLDMTTRRDAYLKHWTEQAATIQNVELGKQPEQPGPQFMTEFLDLKGKGAELKSCYAPLQASLHDCRRLLESDLNPGNAKSLAGEWEKIRKSHQEVDLAAEAYRNALKAIIDKMAVPSPSAPSGEKPGDRRAR